MSKKKIFGLIASIPVLVFLVTFGSFIEEVKADQIAVIQIPITGTLMVYTTPGAKLQWYGKVTRYKKSEQYWFSEKDDQGEKIDQSIKIRFNDAGEAMFSGSIRWDMPLDEASIKSLHMRYSSWKGIEQQLVRTVVEKSVYMVGPLMSSRESYAEKRPDLIRFIDDMVNHGVYQTAIRDDKRPDSITGKEKTVQIVELVRDPLAPNGIARQEISPVTEYGIKFKNLSPNRVAYSEAVTKQITVQQEATMAVQTAQAMALKAEQDAIKAEKEGQANAATAKWLQEVIKAQMVTEAEQNRDVAELDKQAADYERQANILRGQGEAERKRLVMNADGALELKLKALVEINRNYASAISEYQGNWVPQTVFGGNGGESMAAGGAQQLIQMLTAKTAMDLGTDITVTKGRTSKDN